MPDGPGRVAMRFDFLPVNGRAVRLPKAQEGEQQAAAGHRFASGDDRRTVLPFDVGIAITAQHEHTLIDIATRGGERPRWPADGARSMAQPVAWPC